MRSLLAFVACASAQQLPAPHIGYVYPAGGRQGSTFEVTVGGQFLDGAARAQVSGQGVQARVVEHVKPTPPAEIAKLRERLRELVAKGGDAKEVVELRTRIMAAARRPASPALGETVTLQVTIEPGVAPGEREIRLATRNGLTNPLAFAIGHLPEVSKKPQRALVDPRTGRRAAETPAAPVEISLPVLVNGQVMPGGADRYRFRAAKGQCLVAAAGARKLIPYISDAVPGWFQATLTLYDAADKEVRYADDYRFHPDPVLYFEVPEDGEYTLEIRDAIYRGRDDFVYRIALGELPFVTSMFPLGARAGTRTGVEMRGWNLSVAKRTERPKGEPGIRQIAVRSGEWLSTPLPFAVDTLPERPESNPSLKLPVIVNGRIEQPGDSDVFHFKGRRGEEIVAEVLARRLDSPLDSVLRLTDSAGRHIAANDDYEDRGSGLTTHHADSRLYARLPANGTYVLHLADVQNKGGPEYGYRLRVSRPRPDFELRVVPAGINIRAGATAPITVYALRRDGFAGDIALELDGAPQGFALSGGLVPDGVEKLRLTLTAPPAAAEVPARLSLVGRAGKVRRTAVPAEDMMQAFAYHHLVPAQEWLVQVLPGSRRVPWQVPGGGSVKLTAGGKSPLRIAARLGRFVDLVQFALNEPPDGIVIENVAPDREGVTLTVRIDSAKVKPGLRGNLIVDAFTMNGKRRVPLGALPAIAYQVVDY